MPSAHTDKHGLSCWMQERCRDLRLCRIISLTAGDTIPRGTQEARAAASQEMTDSYIPSRLLLSPWQPPSASNSKDMAEGLTHARLRRPTGLLDIHGTCSSNGGAVRRSAAFADSHTDCSILDVATLRPLKTPYKAITCPKLWWKIELESIESILAKVQLRDLDHQIHVKIVQCSHSLIQDIVSLFPFQLVSRSKGRGTCLDC